MRVDLLEVAVQVSLLVFNTQALHFLNDEYNLVEYVVQFVVGILNRVLV